MASLGAFYKAGLDYVGRQVVVFVGRQFPAPKVDLSKVSARDGEGGREREAKKLQYMYYLCLSPSLQAMAYFIHVMETVVHKDYILVYFNTLSESDNQADSSFFKQLYTMVDDR